MPDTPRKRGRPRKDQAEIKLQLLESAKKLFNRDGYFGTDSNKIAREAGLGPASFYRCFANKKDAFLQAYALWVDEDWKTLEAGIAAAQNVEAVLPPYLARHEEWSRFRRSMHALVASDDDARRFHLSVREKQLRRLSDFLNGLGAPPLGEAELLMRFLSFERCANALADGEVAALGCAPSDFTALLRAELARILKP